MDTLRLLVGIVGTIIIGLIALVVVWNLYTGKIDLLKLLSGDDSASLSRFQFLVFTFIIGLSYLLIVIKTQAPDKLPDVGNAWALLGISGGSYVLGKGIQMSADTAVDKARIAAQQPQGQGQEQGQGGGA
jgi:hypothetical protein